jgi:hypothetical protein
MGGIWTGLIIAQIAATVLFTAVAYVAQRQAAQIASTRAAFPAEGMLRCAEMDRSPTEDAADTTEENFLRRYTAIVRELERRVAAESTVAGVTLAQQLPLMPHANHLIEVDEGGSGESSSNRERRVPTAAVGLDFFEVFHTRVLSGRGLSAQDLATGANTVVVNHLFVDRILAGRNAIGRRIRYKPEDSRSRAEPGPWLEIVGVVGDLVPDSDAPLRLDNPARPLVYRLLSPSQAQSYPLHLAAHVRGDPGSLAPTLRRIAADLSPTLRLNNFQPLDQATGSDARAWRVLAGVILLVSAIALVLSLAGIYSVMSFTVSRRTREIAVRVALGAPAASVVADIFRRPLGHVAAGVAVGCVLMAGLVALGMRGSEVAIGTATRHAALLFGYGTTMMGVCALACIGPVLRVFRVEPTDALRDDG